jgi:hypothetical protein
VPLGWLGPAPSRLAIAIAVPATTATTMRLVFNSLPSLAPLTPPTLARRARFRIGTNY